ncbi:MAG: cysteine desulfurase [Ruminococcus sp.]|nr:cysteine desulfurase [Ruminococcus sp.]
MIYFDNAATTKPLDSAVKAAVDAMSAEGFGNPSSLHGLGLSASQKVSAARKVIAGSIGASPEEIYFTSGATEADNTAVIGAAMSNGKRRRQIVTTSVEHPAVAEPIRRLEAQGFEVVRVSPREGGYFADDIVNAVSKETCLVSCMAVNNETGSVLPIEEAFRRIKKQYPDTLTHCDAVQCYMKLPVKVKSLNADMISLSGHKVHAPKGIGALYIRKGVHIASLISGGGQERGFRSGTESVPLIAAFGAAVGELCGSLDERFAYVSELSALLRSRVSALGIAVNSPADGSPYVNSIAVPGLRSEVLLHFLEQKEIYVSSGSACSKGKKSSVLSEFGVPDKLADFTIRVSFCAENTADEIEALIAALKEAQDTLQKVR